MASVEELTQLFSNVGFEGPKVKEIVKNKKVSTSLESLIKAAPQETRWDKSTRALAHNLASQIKGNELPNQELIVSSILDGSLKTALQVDAAYKLSLIHI